MTRFPLALLLLLTLVPTSPCAAQSLDKKLSDAWTAADPTARDWADAASTVGVVAAVIAPCLADRPHDQSWGRCLANEGLHVGSAVAVVSIIKLFVHRERPNGADNKSFPSMHTAIACAATIRTDLFMLCPGVAIGRIISGYHYPGDTAAAAGIAATINLSFSF